MSFRFSILWNKVKPSLKKEEMYFIVSVCEPELCCVNQMQDAHAGAMKAEEAYYLLRLELQAVVSHLIWY